MKLQRLPQNWGESTNQAITQLNQSLRYLPRLSCMSGYEYVDHGRHEYCTAKRTVDLGLGTFSDSEEQHGRLP